jgi:hypothetical protein
MRACRTCRCCSDSRCVMAVDFRYFLLRIIHISRFPLTQCIHIHHRTHPSLDTLQPPYFSSSPSPTHTPVHPEPGRTARVRHHTARRRLVSAPRHRARPAADLCRVARTRAQQVGGAARVVAPLYVALAHVWRGDGGLQSARAVAPTRSGACVNRGNHLIFLLYFCTFLFCIL